MKYIAGIELRDNGKTVLIKRTSNTKWYGLNDILKQLKSYLLIAENGKVKDQFYSEYKEIEKICFLFSVKIEREFKYTPPKRDEEDL